MSCRRCGLSKEVPRSFERGGERRRKERSKNEEWRIGREWDDLNGNPADLSP